MRDNAWGGATGIVALIKATFVETAAFGQVDAENEDPLDDYDAICLTFPSVLGLCFCFLERRS